MVRVPQGGKHLAGEAAFEATDHLGLAHAFGSAAAHVCLGSFVVTQSDDYDAMERRIGLAVAAAVEAMAVGPARGSRYGVHSAQGGEGGLGAETLGVAASGHEQGRRRVGPYSEAVRQVGSYCIGELFELTLQVLDLLAELMVAAGQGTKGVLGRCGGAVQAARRPGRKPLQRETKAAVVVPLRDSRSWAGEVA